MQRSPVGQHGPAPAKYVLRGLCAELGKQNSSVGRCSQSQGSAFVHQADCVVCRLAAEVIEFPASLPNAAEAGPAFLVDVMKEDFVAKSEDNHGDDRVKDDD